MSRAVAARMQSGVWPLHTPNPGLHPGYEDAPWLERQ